MPIPSTDAISSPRPPQAQPCSALSFWSAVIAAVVVLIGGGSAYRLAEARFARFCNRIPLSAGTLKEVPVSLGEWTSRDVPLDTAVFPLLRLDDFVNRSYVRNNIQHPVALFIGYSSYPREVTPHRPEICYPSAGWVLAESEVIEIRCADQKVVRFLRQRFRRGGLGDREVLALSHYLVNDEYVVHADGVSRRLLAARGDAPYVILVQFLCEASGVTRDLEQVVHELAALLTPEVRSVVKQAVGRALASDQGAGS